MKFIKYPLSELFRRWLPLAVTATLVIGFVHVADQQMLRQEANDPQISQAEGAAAALESGLSSPAGLAAANKIDIAKSLATYFLIYGADGKLVATDAALDGAAPAVPKGVLDYARTHGQDRVTWQPRPGVRGAIVAQRFDGKNPGVVVVGRSLREVEKRETQLVVQTVAAWFITMLGILLAVAF